MPNNYSVSSESASTFQNPIMETGADPWIFEHQGLYYYCYSDNKTSIFVSVAGSPLELDKATPAMVWQAKSGTAYSHQTWAPEIYHLDGRWYIYYAASNGRNSTHRMYVLEADRPQGPYRFKGQITPPTDRWAIDGTVFEYQGERYYIWSGWDGRTNIQQNLYISKMKNPWTLATVKNANLKTRKLRRKLADETQPNPWVMTVEAIAREDGPYVLEVGYTCDATSMMRLEVNDENHVGLHFHPTGPSNWQTHYETIELKKGRNILNFASGIGAVQLKDVKVKIKGSDRMLISSPEHVWEKFGGPAYINEGPTALQKNGQLHIVYSASGSWTDDYQMGLLTFTGGDILDRKNWKKKATPIFTKTSDVFGPGHASFIRFKDKDWIVYHTAKHSGAGWNREVRMQPFTWGLGDVPILGTPASNTDKISIDSPVTAAALETDKMGA